MPQMSEMRKCENCRNEFRAYYIGKRPLPKFCGRKCYAEHRAHFAKLRSERREEAKPVEPATVRVPAKFFHDHEERECEPFCTPLRRGERFVWLALNDEGLNELLSDAQFYSDEWGPDAIGDGGALKRSAAATVKAIEAARRAAVTVRVISSARKK